MSSLILKLWKKKKEKQLWVEWLFLSNSIENPVMEYRGRSVSIGLADFESSKVNFSRLKLSWNLRKLSEQILSETSCRFQTKQTDNSKADISLSHNSQHWPGPNLLNTHKKQVSFMHLPFRIAMAILAILISLFCLSLYYSNYQIWSHRASARTVNWRPKENL